MHFRNITRLRNSIIHAGIASTLCYALVSPSHAQDSAKTNESKFISSARQVTFEGRRAGEGYFNADGSKLVFQSERRADNPFFQIYLLDFETGDVEPISPGHGKTTCAWIHPNSNLVLFSSTQDDPEARKKQKQEIEFRESGQARRYSWDYDETYEIYAFDRKHKSYQKLTDARGYDAEASYSPDGKLIAFASNRNAYTRDLSAKEQEEFERDPANMMDIFIMNSDGTNVRQLTDVPGYDGGPFFSPDGKRICWRRFSTNGATAEIMTMNIDGSDQRQITQIGAMSWAPFYHPSGDYLIFTTNKHGFGNFELYMVDAEGTSPPVRVTYTDGFDGLASFTPDGKKLTWTSNRNSKKDSQIYLADWNNEAALEALSGSAESLGLAAAKNVTPGFDQRDIMRHVDYLCRKELGGRMTGSSGEKKATAYVAAYMDHLGLKPAGDQGSWFQTFEFPAGAELGPDNKLIATLDSKVNFEVDKDWRPLTFSGSLEVPASEVVFAGYGIVAPEQDDQPAYDSYKDLDLTGKWAMVFRFVPENVSPKRRQHLQFHAGLRKKAFQAREKGAVGMIVVSGPNAQVRNQLVAMQNDLSPSGSSLAAVSITDNAANKLLSSVGTDVKKLQDRLDDGEEIFGMNLGPIQLTAQLDVQKITGKGRNVIGRLQAGDNPSDQVVIVGAHIDHLGVGGAGNSLAKNDEKGQIHLGADDNASGVAGMLEIAAYLAAQQKSGKIQLARDVLFAGWSGEELGLQGSDHFVKTYDNGSKSESANASFHDFKLSYDSNGKLLLNDEPAKMEELEGSLKFIGESVPDFEVEIAKNESTTDEQLASLKKLVNDFGVQKIKVTSAEPRRGIIAALNMDMIGRLEDKLVLQGIGSSDYWNSVIESKNAVIGLPLSLNEDTDLPTDASSFYRAGVPILSAFTGSHTDYHTPRDTPDKLDYEETARVARLMGLITRTLATTDELPRYVKRESKPKQAVRGGIRAYLGSVPSYGDDVVGVKLSDVTKGAPADVAGVKGGDIIIGLAGKKIENIYDYTAIIDALKVGQETEIIVDRNGKELTLKITPGSRQ